MNVFRFTQETHVIALHLESRAALAPLPTARPLVEQPRERALDELAHYQQDGWDGDDAKAITKPVIVRARAVSDAISGFLGQPFVTPGTIGSVGLLWQTSAVRVQISIRPDFRVQVYAKRRDRVAQYLEFVVSAHDTAAKVASQIRAYLFDDDDGPSYRRTIRSSSSSRMTRTA